MEPADSSDSGSGNSCVSTEQSECPNGTTDLENWADANVPRFYPRSQGYPEPVPEPLRAPHPPPPQFVPLVYPFPAAQVASSVFHPTPVFRPTNELLESILTAPPVTVTPAYLVPDIAPSSGSYPRMEDIRFCSHRLQSSAFQVPFTAAPRTPNIPRSSPLEGPREAPGPLEVIPGVAATLPSTLWPPPGSITPLENTPFLVPLGPIYNIVPPPVASSQQGEQAPQSADPEHLSDPQNDSESNT